MELLSTSAAAALLGISPAAVIDRITNGTMVSFAFPNTKNTKYYIPKDIVDFNPKKHRSKNCETIVVTNFKGGVGKTTVSTNLAAALSALGKEVLLVDMDPQANTTRAFFGYDEIQHGTIKDLLHTFYDKSKKLEKEDVTKCVLTKQFQNTRINILPSELALSTTVEMLRNTALALNKLDIVLDLVRDKFDYIIIDTPPSPGAIFQMCLYASDTISIVVEPEQFAFSGMDVLLNEIDAIKDDIANTKGNSELTISSVVINKIKTNTSVHNMYIPLVEDMAKEEMVPNVYYIKDNTRIKDSQNKAIPLFEYKDELAAGFTAGGPILKMAYEIITRGK